jgi:polyisoprenoid-binding protein YceI
MQRLVSTAALVAALASAASAAGWQIDPVHSSVQFSIRHMMVSNVRGEFGKVSGTVRMEGDDPTQAVVEATIDAGSIDTREPKRDEHLRSPDFLDTAKYPTITFKSKKVERAGADKWKLSGDLTLHGVTREVVLDVEGSGTPVKDLQGKMRAGAHATTKLDRKDFGIVWNKLLDGGGIALGNEVQVVIDVEAIQQ